MMTMNRPTFDLVDDGTMDTVLRCARCGHVERFTYAGSLDDTSDMTPAESACAYAQFIWECRTILRDEHRCEPSITEVLDLLNRTLATFTGNRALHDELASLQSYVADCDMTAGEVTFRTRKG